MLQLAEGIVEESLSTLLDLYRGGRSDWYYNGIHSERDLAFYFSCQLLKSFGGAPPQDLARFLEWPYSAQNLRGKLDTYVHLLGTKVGIEFKYFPTSMQGGRPKVLGESLRDIQNLTELCKVGFLDLGYFFFLSEIDYFIKQRIPPDRWQPTTLKAGIDPGEIVLAGERWTLKNKEVEWQRGKKPSGDTYYYLWVKVHRKPG